MKKPNLFILGAPKCGTTAMAQWLSAHQDVYVSSVKEPHYFCEDHRLTRSLKEYEALFDSADSSARWVCEASVWYLFSDSAVSNIQKYSPESMFIVMLRNPVDMAVSMHEQHRFNGNELIADFERALALSDQRLAGNLVGIRDGYYPSAHLAYYRSCALGWQVARLLELVPRHRIHFVLFDDLGVDPGGEYRKVLSFLGVSEDIPMQFRKVNAAKERRSYSLDYAIVLLARLKERLRIKWRFGLLSRIRKRNLKYRDRAPLRDEIRAEMIGRFRDDVRLLGDCIDRDLEHWVEQRS